MRSCVLGARETGGEHGRQRREAKNRHRQDENGEHRHLDVLGFDLLSEIFRRSSDHQTRDEYGQDGE